MLIMRELKTPSRVNFRVLILLAKSWLSRSSKKQDCTALSTAEAELSVSIRLLWPKSFDCGHSQNRRDLPRNFPLDRVEVLEQSSDTFSIHSEDENLHEPTSLDQHPATVEETRAYFETLYNNLAIEVEKVNTVNRKLRETNADLTTELARYKNQEM
ncbi:hypothetical protein Tco_0168482 [Tanacetum coccineum]